MQASLAPPGPPLYNWSDLLCNEHDGVASQLLRFIINRPKSHFTGLNFKNVMK